MYPVRNYTNSNVNTSCIYAIQLIVGVSSTVVNMVVSHSIIVYETRSISSNRYSRVNGYLSEESRHSIAQYILYITGAHK